MRISTPLTFVAIAAFAALASCDRQTAGDSRKPASKEWTMIEGDWGNTRFSTLDKINTGNAKTLGAAWMHKFEGETSRAVPVVSGGIMYLTAGTNVYALNPKTGEEIWKAKPPIAPTGLYKGVTVADGKVFIGLSDSNVVALDAKSGAQLWMQMIGDDNVEPSAMASQSPTGQFVSTAPAYAAGLVISGMVNGDYGVRGRVVALDAVTGKPAWRFDSIPGPGEVGHDTWPADNAEWQHGGGGVWTTPAVDPDLGLVIFGVGNPVPQWGGELRAGDNLFSDSVVAVDLKTGKYKWHFQLVHHDIWEQDVGTPMILYDAEVDGKPRKAVGVMRTDGYLFMLDRATGKPIWPVEERPVPQNARVKTSPTQPFPVGADEIGPACVDPANIPAGFKALCHWDPVDYDTPNAMYPINTTRAARMAYSPQTKYFYAAASPAWPFWLHRFEDGKFFSAAGTSVPGIKATGLIAAVDSRTNKIAWQKPMPYEIQNGSGFAATAGGVLFHGEPDGQFQVYDAKNGDLLYSFQTGSNVSGGAMTYEIDGEQYVAAMATNTLWTFKLGGTLQPQPAPPAPRTVTAFGGRIVATDAVEMSPTVQDTGLGKLREAVDEYAVSPTRVKVTVGGKVTWTNNGKLVHDATAVDGSWTTGPIEPGKSATLTFKTPGSFTYISKANPWTYGQLIVEE